MRVCIVYDCLYPWTVGGAERWMRNLAEALAADGHEVTYLTRRQWEPGAEPRIPGVTVVAVSRAEPLYGPDGNRTIGEPLRFGWGVLRHLARNRRSYDVVHTCSFPYFSVLAAGTALAGTRTMLGVDWFEVWTKHYWTRYLGGPRGWIGWAVQRLCAFVPQRAFVFSDLHAQRLRDEGLRSEPVRLAGLYAGSLDGPASDPAAPREPLVVFAGRHIAEKQVPALPPAIAAARARLPGLRGLILGDGPQRPLVLEAIEREGLGGAVEAPGFVSAGEVADAIARASCLVLPSEREGYGLVVIEAAASATPVVVAAGEDNAAVELVEDGVNGIVARSASPDDLAAAIAEVHERGAALRESTAAWFAREAPRLTASASLATVLATYRAGGADGASARR